MLFIGDRRTGQFKKMINPFCIDCSTFNDCVLYVQDAWGTFYTLRFSNHDALIDCMQALYSEGRATACCDFDIYHGEVEPDREIMQSTEINYDDWERCL